MKFKYVIFHIAIICSLLCTSFQGNAADRVYSLSDFAEPTSSITRGKTAEELWDTGFDYWVGVMHDEDMGMAYTYFRAAADMGNPKGWKYLGYLYRDSKLPIYDLAKAEYAFTKAIAIWLSQMKEGTTSEIGEAAYNLGFMYRDGLGCNKNDKLATALFVHGARKGDDGCQLHAGLMLDKLGYYGEALYWLEECGRNGQGWGAYEAGQIYEVGRYGTGENLIEADRTKAIEMYRLSAATTNLKASDAKRALARLRVPEEGPTSKVNSRRMPTQQFMADYKNENNGDQPSSGTPSPTLKTSNGIIVENSKEVDLGLKSGTLWSGWNLGASSPSEKGKYYQWGETTAFNGNFNKRNANSLPKNLAGSKYDAASAIWGSDWAIPTQEQAMELLFDCEWVTCKLNGVYGFAVTGPNGKSIFIPAAGSYFESNDTTTPYNDNDSVYLWTSEKEAGDMIHCLIWCDNYTKFRNRNGNFMDAKTVRPVRAKKSSASQPAPSLNHTTN